MTGQPLNHLVVQPLRALNRYRHLIAGLVQRDISMRFRQSTLDMLWLVLQPLAQLLIYSFVFQAVLRVRWGEPHAGALAIPTGLMLFVGLTIHTLLAETLIRAPAAITGNVSYVKKVVFPLAILPVVIILSSLVFMAAALVISILASLLLVGYVAPTTPLIVLPLLALTVMTFGIGWLVAAVGVFFRDLNQIMPYITTILLFTSPICFPRDMVPQQFQGLLTINPLTIPVEMTRDMMFGRPFDLSALLPYSAIALLIFFVGYSIFQKLRPGFADVL
ncbi:ABC transporter permease [Acetobacter fabarum]|uniref:ABC transporter permease n=1 Tax=Acetobacter fabarum TaxID=483199 RepID=UPI00312B32B3